ncbi:MAG: alpha/beta hydrolase [Arachidicoccus sp.]|nr:alpha/beta hydrolase [Arachidicoccus sp.]
MIQKFLHFYNSSVSYYLNGHCDQLIFAFHGYSNDSHIFDILEPALQNNYTLISIDLPIHGDTQWREPSFTPKILKEIIDKIIEQENLAKEYFLLGFSLGGRIAMSLFQHFPSQVKGMILLAPDGLYKGSWYRFIAQSFLGTQLTAYLLKRPEKAKSMLEWCQKKHLISNRLYHYADGLLNSKRERTLLAARWIIMRKMRPDLIKICKEIVHSGIPVKLIFGKGDTITPQYNANYFVQRSAPFVQFQEWEAGHLLLREKYYPQLAALFVPKF